jgi:hypothetical protein
MSREDIRQFFRFIDWMMDLPPGLDSLFWKEIDDFEKEKQMPFMTTPERLGRTAGLLAGIEQCLDIRFGEAGLQLLPEIRELTDVELLQTVLEKIKTVASPEELRRLWTP